MKLKIDTQVNLLEVIWLCISGVFILYWANLTFIANGVKEMWLIKIMVFLLIAVIISKFIKSEID